MKHYESLSHGAGEDHLDMGSITSTRIFSTGFVSSLREVFEGEGFRK